MTIEIKIPRVREKEAKSIQEFMQFMANRLGFGAYRYGPPDKSQKYMTRLRLELNAYKKKGNYEQLLNIANYCWLESRAPENKKFHYDPNVDSVTRGKI